MHCMINIKANVKYKIIKRIRTPILIYHPHIGIAPTVDGNVHHVRFHLPLHHPKRVTDLLQFRHHGSLFLFSHVHRTLASYQNLFISEASRVGHTVAQFVFLEFSDDNPMAWTQTHSMMIKLEFLVSPRCRSCDPPSSVRHMAARLQ